MCTWEPIRLQRAIRLAFCHRRFATVGTVLIRHLNLHQRDPGPRHSRLALRPIRSSSLVHRLCKRYTVDVTVLASRPRWVRASPAAAL
jgi:hypothetical protein